MEIVEIISVTNLSKNHYFVSKSVRFRDEYMIKQ